MVYESILFLKNIHTQFFAILASPKHGVFVRGVIVPVFIEFTGSDSALSQLISISLFLEREGGLELAEQ